jgi:hypothetical protein
MFKLFTVLLSLVVSAGSFATEVPKQFRGTWAYPSCEQPTETVLLYHQAYLWIGSRGTELRGVSLAKAQPADWTRVEDSNGTPYFFKLNSPDKLAETFLPRGATKQATPTKEWGSVVYESCKGQLPAELVLLHSEPVALLNVIEEIAPWCSTDRARCVKALFDALDVSRDGSLSKAEIARAVRIGAYLTAVSGNEYPSTEQLSGVTLAAIRMGPEISEAIINSFDYDNSGGVSLTELSLNREQLFGQTTATGANPNTSVERAKKSLKPLEDMFRGLMR